MAVDYTIDPVCQASGPSNNRSKKKVMLKLDRGELATAIPDITGTVDLIVIGTVGEAALPFFAMDTIKTKAPKSTE